MRPSLSLLAGLLVVAAPAALAQPADDALPANWHLLDRDADGVVGISLDSAYALLGDRQPSDVVVAIIDSGVDIEHPDLQPVLWTNAREIAGNGLDDDENGYVDDVHGWSFLGNPSGENVKDDTYELTRLVARCRADQDLDGYDCEALETELEEERAPLAQQAVQIAPLAAAVHEADAYFREHYGLDYDLSEIDLAANSEAADAARPLLFLQQQGASLADLDAFVESINSRLKYGLNPDFDPRPIVGDDYDDPSERFYGNADVTGPNANHGTGVAGLVAAVRGNDLGIDGIAPAHIMVLRAVPGGDERDKDVANAIRYAADNGADIINMSFGKAYSPQKSTVDEAVAYAVSRGVLLVHAAGNAGEDIDMANNFPTRVFLDGATASAWLEVGASQSDRSELAASFSNYGQTSVDLFAPGARVTSLAPGGGVQTADGTSFASPVVAGVAALVKAYFPDLTNDELRQILLDSAVRYTDDEGARPGDGEAVPFGTLSTTGGVVNAAQAVRLASERSES